MRRGTHLAALTVLISASAVAAAPEARPVEGRPGDSFAPDGPVPRAAPGLPPRSTRGPVSDSFSRQPVPTNSSATRPLASAATRPDDAHERLAAEMMAWTEDVVATMKSATDEAGAKAAAGKLDAAAAKMPSFRDRATSLGRMPPDRERALMEKLGKRLVPLFESFKTEGDRIAADPALNPILGEKVKALSAFIRPPATTRPAR